MAGDHYKENLEAFGRWARGGHGMFRILLTIVIAIVAVPAAILFLLPTVLSWLAPPLDLHQDLYAVNRPVAFTFLDEDGALVGRRGAVVGERLTLEGRPA